MICRVWMEQAQGVAQKEQEEEKDKVREDLLEKE